MKRIITLSFILVGVLSTTTLAATTKFAPEWAVKVDTAEVFTMVDVMPEIIGGIQEVYKHIEYPRNAKSAEIEGRVFIRFVVDESGKVKNPEVLKDIGGGCGEAALKGIKKVKFKPGTNDGSAVSVYYTLPITFKLKS